MKRDFPSLLRMWDVNEENEFKDRLNIHFGFELKFQNGLK